MGLVWLAQDEELAEQIALKFLPETVRLDAATLEELKRETRRSRKLAHPNIVKVYDMVSDASAAAISMEFINGETLSGIRARQPDLCFQADQIAPWVKQLLNAMSYAHEEARVVHRDLKPANVMVDLNGRVKVTDFGISSSINEKASRVTMPRGTSGTMAYMSPQQAMGKPPSVQDDIYALGATLFELLTSKPPFFRGDILTQVWEVNPPTVSERRAEFELPGEDIPPAWEETLAACLAKEPEQRPQSMAEVAERLELVAHHHPVHVTMPRIVAAPPPEPEPKNQLPLIIGAIVGIVLLVGGLGYYFGVVAPAKKAQLAQQAQAAQKAAPKWDPAKTALQRLGN
jgi:serine/threonine protein kinase